MVGRNFLATTLLAATLSAQPGWAETVDNFVLIDHKGRAQELFYHGDAPAVVVMALVSE